MASRWCAACCMPADGADQCQRHWPLPAPCSPAAAAPLSPLPPQQNSRKSGMKKSWRTVRRKVATWFSRGQSCPAQSHNLSNSQHGDPEHMDHHGTKKFSAAAVVPAPTAIMAWVPHDAALTDGVVTIEANGARPLVTTGSGRSNLSATLALVQPAAHADPSSGLPGPGQSQGAGHAVQETDKAEEAERQSPDGASSQSSRESMSGSGSAATGAVTLPADSTPRSQAELQQLEALRVPVARDGDYGYAATPGLIETAVAAIMAAGGSSSEQQPSQHSPDSPGAYMRLLGGGSPCAASAPLHDLDHAFSGGSGGGGAAVFSLDGTAGRSSRASAGPDRERRGVRRDHSNSQGDFRYRTSCPVPRLRSCDVAALGGMSAAAAAAAAAMPADSYGTRLSEIQLRLREARDQQQQQQQQNAAAPTLLQPSYSDANLQRRFGRRLASSRAMQLLASSKLLASPGGSPYSTLRSTSRAEVAPQQLQRTSDTSSPNRQLPKAGSDSWADLPGANYRTSDPPPARATGLGSPVEAPGFPPGFSISSQAAVALAARSRGLHGELFPEFVEPLGNGPGLYVRRNSLSTFASEGSTSRLADDPPEPSTPMQPRRATTNLPRTSTSDLNSRSRLRVLEERMGAERVVDAGRRVRAMAGVMAISNSGVAWADVPHAAAVADRETASAVVGRQLRVAPSEAAV